MKNVYVEKKYYQPQKHNIAIEERTGK